MAENVGAIRYTTEVDTSDTLTAEKQIDKATNGMVNDFNKVDAASKRLGTQMTKTSKSVKSGIGGMGRSAGQAGIQFQQFIGQIQGGQNAMLALSAQSADLGFVLGAPLVGAIVGIGASLIGMAAAFGEVKVDMRDVSEIAKQLTGDFSDLDIASQKIARGVIQEDIRKQEKALKALKEQQDDYLTSLKLFTSTEDASEKYKEYTANILALDLALKKSKESLKTLGQGNEDYSNVLAEQQTTIGDLLTSTVHLGNTYGFNARELAVYEAELLGANEAQLDALNLAFDSVDVKIKEAEAIKQLTAEEKKLQTERTKLTGKVQGLGLSKEDQVKARLAKELELLRMAEEQKIEIEGTFQERRIELHRQADERIAGLNEKAAQDSMINFEALENQIVGTFASIATGAQDGKAAIASLASSILTQMVGALIKMGIQAVIGQATAAAATSTAMGAIAVAAAPAAALVSLATAGANAAPAGVGIATVTGIAESVAIAGGRQFGGPVNANDAYRVGESGPEIFSSGGKNFMIPGENGKVIANDDINGGGGFTQNVEIINSTPANVSTSTSEDGKQMRIIINEIATQLNTNQGIIPRSLKSSTNVKFKANS